MRKEHMSRRGKPFTGEEKEGRIRIIADGPLRDFWEKYPDAETPLRVWRKLVRQKAYQNPHEVRTDFSKADFLGGGVTVFDIGGNKYRLVVHIRYDWQKVFIRGVYTHAEYDKRSAEGSL
jgi:mRNA interferase HigB